MIQSKIIKIIALQMILVLGSANLQAASWESKAKNLFEKSEYEACIELTENYQKDNQATMFLAFSHLQQNVFNQSKYDKEKSKAYIAKLEAKLGINDMDNLLYFVNLSDKPYVVKEANKLLNKVFKNINDIDDVPKLVSFLRVEDEKTRKMALTAINRIIKPKRDYVNKGGTLREKDIVVMSSKSLISALVEQIGESKAKSTLVLIEDPALPYLTDASSLEAAKLELSINKKIEARKKKFPESNWYSAVGKSR